MACRANRSVAIPYATVPVVDLALPELSRSAISRTVSRTSMLRRSVAHLAAKCLRLENRVHTASARADGFANADAEARSPDCCCPSHRPRVATALAQIEIDAKFGYFRCMRWPLPISRVAPNHSAVQSRCRLGGSAQHDDEVSALKTELARLRGALHICAVTGACMLLARLGSCARRRRCEAAQVAGKVGPLATTPRGHCRCHHLT